MEKNPFPNPWSKNDRKNPGNSNSQMVVKFQYIGLDGERETADLADHSVGQLCLLSCCPCCVGPCDAQRRRSLIRCVPTFLFIMSVLQIVMFVVSVGVGNGFAPPSCNPMLGPSACAFVTLGGSNRLLIIISTRYELWRLIMPTFLHAGIVHLAMNLFAQLRFGLYLERRWGFLKIMVLYTASAIGGALMSIATQPGISVGASAALMGLLGGHTVEIVMLWHSTNPLERKMALIQMVVWIVVIMLVSAAPVVDAGGHFGGLLTGALVSLCMFGSQSSMSAAARLPWLGGALLAVYFVVITLVVFVPGVLSFDCSALCFACPSFCLADGSLSSCPSASIPNPCSTTS